MKTKLYSSLPFRRALNSLMLVGFLLFAAVVNGQTFSMFAPGGTPPVQDLNDGDDIEVGIKFRVTQIGSVSAILFYQAPSDTGPYVVTLYDSTGAILSASAPTAVAAGAGWRQINLPSSVSLINDGHYVASLYTPNGFYNVEDGAFASGGNDFGSDPLYALNGGVYGNGVYSFGAAAPGFPTSSFNSSNYFVDVLFTTTFPLPVTFTGFKAVEKNYDVNLSWQTATEQNNLGFEVQRSANGTNYEVLGFVDGAGESSSKKNYAYTDRNLEPGMYYYRLKQIDRDGRSKFSPVVTANVKRANTLVLYQNFPNPVKDNATIQYVLPRNMPVTLTLVDLNGRLIRVLDQGMRQTGQHSVTVDASRLMKGTYFYRLETEGQPAEVRKLVVQ